MSTQSFMPRIRNGSGRYTIAILVGILLALQCLLPSAAFASSSGQSAAFSSPNPAKYIPDKVGVSVVRLIIVYSNGTQKALTCTGLGTLVGSNFLGLMTGMYQNAVLTTGDLLSSNSSSCGTLGETDALSSIQILASDEYTSNSPSGYTLGKLTCSAQTGKTVCADAASEDFLVTPAANGSYTTFFTFQTPAPEPYLTANLNQVSSPLYAVGLGKDGAAYPRPTVNVGSLTDPVPENYLLPNAVQTGSTGSLPAGSTVEPGTPVVDSTGELTAFYQANGTKLDLAQADMNQIKLPLTGTSNLVKTNWDKGIDAYYQGNYQQADSFFKQILTAKSDPNPNFKAPLFFDNQAKAALPHVTPTVSSRPGSGGAASSDQTLSTFTLIGLGAAFVCLLLLLILVTVLVGRSHKRRRELERFAAEQKEAQRQAEEEVQRQRSQPIPPAEVPCPNCHQPVRLGDSFCPYCRFPLSPSASGLGVRLAGSAPLPAVEITVPAPAAPSISDQPTIHFPPSTEPKKEVVSAEKTLKRSRRPPRVQSQEPEPQTVAGHSLNLMVGTRSDPGLKRKYKPNEDSLFAVQGARTHNSQPQQFGLFVVADGMGGHANGQDASRQAIQTMIDFMLPKISSSEPMDDEAFTRLLGEGVQQANQAVHQRNLEARADMGTTMTTSLVVGSTAYVANVGDSRTYLYRPSLGLSKVTNDHSVVASLVEAGIIQPDDIYTHPKRNQIYRSLGEKPVVEVDTFKVELQPGDILLLCSDGLWDMVRDPQIQQVLSKPITDPNKTGQELIKAALEGGGEDNVSVIVVQLAETDLHTGQTGVQLLAKPETVTLPNLPPV